MDDEESFSESDAESGESSDSDSNSIESDGSDLEWVGGVGKDDELDEDTLTKVKANEPSTTSLRVIFDSDGDGWSSANNIDWEKESLIHS